MVQLACLNDSYVSGGDVCILCPFFVYPFLHGGATKMFFLPQNHRFRPKIIISGHKWLQPPQMGWTSVKLGWTLYFTSGMVSWDLLACLEIPLGGPRMLQKWLLFASNWSFLGPSGAPQGHFHGGKKVLTDPPRCEIQCSTVFDQCSTHLRQLRLPKAKYDHFESKGAIKWP